MPPKDEFEPIAWFDAEPTRLKREIEAMKLVAPNLQWHQDAPAGYWQGIVPKWPFTRPAPPLLDEFLAGQRLTVRITCSQAHPAIAPRLFPLDPEPDVQYRTMHEWHVSGDGSLCLLQSADVWTGEEMTSELAVKAAGWFIEYLLVSRGVVTKMTVGGIAESEEFDHLLLGPELPSRDG